MNDTQKEVLDLLNQIKTAYTRPLQVLKDMVAGTANHDYRTAFRTQTGYYLDDDGYVDWAASSYDWLRKNLFNTGAPFDDFDALTNVLDEADRAVLAPLLNNGNYLFLQESSDWEYIEIDGKTIRELWQEADQGSGYTNAGYEYEDGEYNRYSGAPSSDYTDDLGDALEQIYVQWKNALVLVLNTIRKYKSYLKSIEKVSSKTIDTTARNLLDEAIAAPNASLQPLDAIIQPALSSIYSKLGLHRFKDNGEEFYRQLEAYLEYYKQALEIIDFVTDNVADAKELDRDIDNARDFFKESIKEVETVMKPLDNWLGYMGNA